jgi:hypothetical protein
MYSNSKKILFYQFIALLISLISFGQVKNLKNIQKLTFGGDNAEAYFSPSGTMSVSYTHLRAHETN